MDFVDDEDDDIEMHEIRPPPTSSTTSTTKKQRNQKRMVVSVHSSIPQEFVDVVSNSIKTLHFASLDVSDYVPESTVSIYFNSFPKKPMIYVDPKDIDEQFISNIERKSIVLTNQLNNIKLNTIAAYYTIIMLPLHIDSFRSALQFVFTENKIIGVGFNTRFYGDIWKEILGELPNISNKHSETIAAQAKNRDQFIAAFDSLSKKGVPQRVLNTVMTFLTAPDPNTFLVQPTTRKKKSSDDV